MTIVAWIIMRVVFAWLFLYALKGLLSDWKASVGLVGIVCPFAPSLASIAMVVVMFLGALSILLGVCGQLGGILLTLYCLIGARVHYKLAGMLSTHELSEKASNEDSHILAETIAMGVVGHVTSAQKNIVLASVALFFAMMGTGPWSLTGLLY